MKKFLNIALILVLFSNACKAPWEDYQPPAVIVEEPEPKEPTEPDPTVEKIILKVISIGIGNKNAVYDDLENLIKSEKADFVVLREVDKNNTRTGIDINQAELMAERVGMEYVFSPQLDNYAQGQFGLAILSHFPITESLAKKLPVGPVWGGDARPLAMMKVKVKDDFEVAFIGVHIDDGSRVDARLENRPIQARTIIETIQDIDIPTIVAGNFYFETQNDNTMPILKELLIPGCTVCLPTLTTNFVADHIMFRAIGNPKLISYKLSPEIKGKKAAIAALEFEIPKVPEVPE